MTRSIPGAKCAPRADKVKLGTEVPPYTVGVMLNIGPQLCCIFSYNNSSIIMKMNNYDDEITYDDEMNNCPMSYITLDEESH